MAVGSRQGKGVEQLSSASGSPTDTGLARVFQSGCLRGCKQLIGFSG